MPRWKQLQNQDRFKKEGGASAEDIFGGVMGGIGALSGLASFGMGIDAMITQKRVQAEMQRKNEQIMKRANARMEKDYFAGLNVPLDPFKAQEEANLVSATTSTEALKEGDSRSLLAGVGKINMATNEANEKNRNDLSQALYDNNKMKADSQQAINQGLIKMDVGAAQDASVMARDASALANQAGTQAQEGLVSGLQSGAGLIPGYLEGQQDKLTTDFLREEGIVAALDNLGVTYDQESFRDTLQNSDLFKNKSNPERKDLLDRIQTGDKNALQLIIDLFKK